jgi:putative chitinase
MLIPDACRSAAWFWKTNGLNELADADEFLKITKRINGGTTGQAERQVFCDRAKKVLL